MPCGRLIIVSGPSGAGKTTVLRVVRERCRLPLVPSVSATTRPPRPGETDGVDYHFLSLVGFQSRREKGEFLECFQVFGRGYWYGTLWSEVRSGLKADKWVVLNIDVNGAQAVMERFADAMTFFVRPSSIGELERRLRLRATETDEVIRQRLKQAEYELTLAPRYQHPIINDDVDQAVEQICKILTEQWEADHNDRRIAGRGNH